MGRGTSIGVRHTVFAVHSENTITGCLGASKECIDRRDAKCDGVRRGALLCRKERRRGVRRVWRR